MNQSEPPASSGNSIFAVGDVHGCAEELDDLLRLLPLSADSTLVFLGDYIDRGPKSQDVVQLVLDASKICKVVTLIGNHEEMFLDFLKDPTSRDAVNFIYNGGGATLASYADGTGGYSIPEEHLAFFRKLKLTWESAEHFFVHAGVPDGPLEEIDLDASRRQLLWMRDPFLRSKYSWSKIPVHGHTMVHGVDIRPNRINVDSGCVGGGSLSAIELPGKKVYSVPRREQPRTIALTDPSSRRVAVRFPGCVPVRIERKLSTLVLETVNFNEYGMLLRDNSMGDKGSLSTAEPVRGSLVISPSNSIPFTGAVVRFTDTPRGLFYAVRFEGPILVDAS